MHPGEVELRNGLDDPRAADAGDPDIGEARLVRPGVGPDHAEARLERRRVDPHPLDRPRRRPLPTGDLRPFERRAGRARRCEEPLAVAENDLRVRPDVDDQHRLVLLVRSLRQDHARGVGPDVPGDAREDVGARALVDRQPELTRRPPNRFVDRQGERRAAELRRIDAEEEVVHHGVPDEDDLEDVVAVDRRLLRELGDELREAAAHRPGQLLLRARVHHHVRHPAHQILAEPDLRVHLTRGGEHLAGVQIAEMTGDRRRPDVEGDPVGSVVIPRPHCGDLAPVVDGDGDAPVGAGLTQRALQRLDDVRVEDEILDSPLARERFSQPGEVAARGAEVGLLDLDEVEPDDRVDLDVAHVRFLAHDLLVHLALGWNVDHDVGEDPRGATEPATGGQGPIARIGLLDPAHGGQRRRVAGDPVLRVLALAHRDLATPADPATTADRVEVDPERAGGVEHGRADRHRRAAARRHERDAGLVAHAAGASPPRRAARPPRRPG